MESCSFQNQLLSVMEVLAKAAVAEIDRRVDESCAVLRLEVSQSRRDIDLLKRKCEGMEAELKRSRIRVRRRALQLPVGARFSPLVKVMVKKEKQSTEWDRQMQTPSDPQQCAETEPATEPDPTLIKQESLDEETWRNDAEDKLSESSGAEQLPGFEAPPTAQTDGFSESYPSVGDPDEPDEPESLLSPVDGFDSFPNQQPNIHPHDTELIVKLEEDEPDENAAPLESGHVLLMDKVDGEMWMSGLCREAGGPSVSYAEQQFEQNPSAFASQSSLILGDTGVTVHSAAKSQSALMSAARVKRRARTFGCKRSHPDDGHGALSQNNSANPSLIPQLYDYQMRNPDEEPTNPAGSVYGHGRSSFSLARRLRTPWRPCQGEKRFGCTYCDKTFMRFSQLKEHLRSHTGEKPYSCAQCGRSFTKQCNLIRHAVVHSGEKPHECAVCGKCFTQRSSLTSHQKTVH